MSEACPKETEVVRILHGLVGRYGLYLKDHIVDLVAKARKDRLLNTGGKDFFQEWTHLRGHLKIQAFGVWPMAYYMTIGGRYEECMNFRSEMDLLSDFFVNFIFHKDIVTTAMANDFIDVFNDKFLEFEH